MSSSPALPDFTEEQKRYLEGFAAGTGMSLAVLPTFAGTLGVTVGPKPRGTDYAQPPMRCTCLPRIDLSTRGKNCPPRKSPSEK